MSFHLPSIVFAVVTASFLGTLPNASAAQKAQVYKRKIVRKVELSYLLYTPDGYAAKSAKQWPLIVFLHGAGERGTNLDKVAIHGPPKLVKSGRAFPFIIVSPQCPDGEIWSSEVLNGLIDEISRKQAVDPRRIYLTGLSMGGYGTWSLATEHPERFAAIAPICGGGEPIRIALSTGARRAALKALPVWAFHGGKDPVVKPEESERMVEAFRRVGDHDTQLTVYPEAQHDSWTETYDNPKLYEWFLAHELPRTR